MNVLLDTEQIGVAYTVPVIKAPRRRQVLLTLAKLEDVFDSPAHTATQSLPPLMARAGASMPLTGSKARLHTANSYLKAASLNTGSSYLSTRGLNWSLLRKASRFGSVLQQQSPLGAEHQH